MDDGAQLRVSQLVVAAHVLQGAHRARLPGCSQQAPTGCESARRSVSFVATRSAGGVGRRRRRSGATQVRAAPLRRAGALHQRVHQPDARPQAEAIQPRSQEPSADHRPAGLDAGRRCALGQGAWRCGAHCGCLDGHIRRGVRTRTRPHDQARDRSAVCVRGTAAGLLVEQREGRHPASWCGTTFDHFSDEDALHAVRVLRRISGQRLGQLVPERWRTFREHRRVCAAAARGRTHRRSRLRRRPQLPLQRSREPYPPGAHRSQRRHRSVEAVRRCRLALRRRVRLAQRPGFYQQPGVPGAGAHRL